MVWRLPVLVCLRMCMQPSHEDEIDMHYRYKSHRVDGRVTAVWPGSAISYKEMIDGIRPEDFDIVYRSRNRFRFMGNGRTQREFRPGEDLAFYLYK